MKALFLDFDGVLNTWPKPDRSGNFNKTACINLEFLLNKLPELKIVVSSAWRIQGLDGVRRVLQGNGIDPRRVIDITGQETLDNKSYRGNQIKCWLERNKDVDQFAIVDDESDMEPFMDKLVKTNRMIGLTQANVEKLLAILS